ncbi:hypothetical protein HK104_004869, partial [Borealophlyctis nickersoniae]
MWDLEVLERAVGVSENVAVALVGKLRRLPVETGAVLMKAACIGTEFDLNILAPVANLTPHQCATLLWPAVKEGFLVPITQTTGNSGKGSDSGRSSGSFGVGSEKARPVSGKGKSGGQSSGNIIMSYKFAHSRVHRAAYGMIPHDSRAEYHLPIGRHMRTLLSTNAHGHNYDPAPHYNEAITLLVNPQERAYVASLNLTAGVRALKAGAGPLARRNMEMGLCLLEGVPDVWESHYEVMFGLTRGIAEVAGMEAAWAESEAALHELTAHAREGTDKLAAIAILSSGYHVQGKFRELLQVGMAELKAEGVVIPESEEECEECARKELDKLEKLISGRSVEEVMAEKREADLKEQLLHSVLTYTSGGALTAGFMRKAELMYLKACTLSLQSGFSHKSIECFAFCIRCYLSLCPVPNFPRIRWILALVTHCLPSASTDARGRSRLALSIQGFSYITSIKEFERNLDQGEADSLESGQFSLVLYGMFCAPVTYFTFGKPASAWREYDKKRRPFLERFKGLFMGAWLSLMGELEAFAKGLPYPHLGGEAKVVGLIKSLILSVRLTGAVVYEKPEVRELLKGALDNKLMSIGHVRHVDMFFAQAIVAASEWHNANEEKRVLLMEEMDSALEKLRLFTDQEPRQHYHKYLLAYAEKGRIMNNMEDACKFYERAIEEAHTHGARMYEAYGTELYGRFWFERGSKSLARGLLHEAIGLWHGWGSEAKARLIYGKYSTILDIGSVNNLGKLTPNTGSVRSAPLHSVSVHNGSTASDSHTCTVDLDLTTVLKVAQSLSNESSLEILLIKIIKFVMENAGAKKGALVLHEDGKLLIEALGTVTESGENHRVLQAIPIDSATREDGVPCSVLYYVYRTREPLVLTDAYTDPTHGNDPYIREGQTRSILCCPIMVQSTVTGAVYLENDLQPAAFTPDRLELIQSVMASASIAIENAKLTKTNTELTAALRQTANNQSGGPRYNVDGPIKRTIDSLQAIKARLPHGDAGITQIDVILKTLTSTDLFQTNIDEMNDEQGRGVDKDTKMWIENSLLARGPRANAVEKGADAKERMVFGR